MCALANKSARIVPHLAAERSRPRKGRPDDQRSGSPRLADRRVQKTRKLLLQALGSLLHEKRYDAIVVQEILDRANVGRSTFYAHFRDKDELLLGAIRDVLQIVAPAQPRAPSRSEQAIQFSRPMFEHIERHLRASKHGLRMRSREIVHARLRRVLEERVAEDLGAIEAHHLRAGASRELLARYLTATFVLVLEWWVDHESKRSAAEMDQVFRSLVLPSLVAAMD